jgi:nitrous oxidase accessory protein
MAKLLLNSPSVKILKWAQSEFPGLHPGGVTDSNPLMKPPQSQYHMTQRDLSDG